MRFTRLFVSFFRKRIGKNSRKSRDDFSLFYLFRNDSQCHLPKKNGNGSSRWADFDPICSCFASRNDVDATGFDFHLCNLPRYPLCCRCWKGKRNNSKLRISLIKRLGAQGERGSLHLMACVSGERGKVSVTHHHLSLPFSLSLCLLFLRLDFARIRASARFLLASRFFFGLTAKEKGS